MKNVGIECEIPPNQLRQGFGTPICVVLLSIVNKVIQKSQFSFKKAKLEEKKSNSKEEGLEIEDETPDLINNEIDYGDETLIMKLIMGMKQTKKVTQKKILINQALIKD